MEEIDLEVFVAKLLKKWYWFVLSLTVCLGAAGFYLATTEKEYPVGTTIQLKDQSLTEKGSSQAKLLSGFELLSSGSELEDEIGILTSFSTISQSLIGLDMEVSYYHYPSVLGKSGKVVAKEMYPAPFEVKIDTGAWQLIYTPIFLEFISAEQFRVRVSTKPEASYLYHPYTRQVVSKEIIYELDTILSINQPLITPYFKFSVSNVSPTVAQVGSSYYISLSSLNDIANYYRKSLQYEQISENSNIVKLSLKSRVPQKDIRFLASLGATYINNDLKKKNRLGERTISFIDTQLQGVSDSLRRAESSLESFRSRSNIVDIQRTSNTLADQLFSLEEKQAQLQVQNKYYLYMSDYLARNDDVSDIMAPSSVGIQDHLLNNLLMQLSALNEEKISKDFSSSKQNPVLQVLEKKIRSTKQALIDNIDNLIGSNKIALQESNRRIGELKGMISRLPENERNLTDINRRFKFNDNIYNYLLQKRAEAGIAIASNVPDKSIIDFPRLLDKQPISPNTILILLIALFSGFMIPIGIGLVSEFFQTSLESYSQLENWTKIPLVERIAKLNGKELKNAYSRESYLAHAFRYIRHHIDFIGRNNSLKIIGVSSAKSGEGKTFCALNLAITFAHSGNKTLLIDADLHRPALSSRLDIDITTGLGEYLVDGSKPQLHKTAYENLDFIGAGRIEQGSSDLLSHNRLAQLLIALKDQYSLIILDTPPVGVIADYLQLAIHVDYTLLVVRQDYTKKDEVQRLSRLVERHSLKCGIIYNGADQAEEYKGYYKLKYTR
ncbi:GumC family protein [Cesiribacter andamanensis]|uniref:non-specific protein-tyrosine kinase n=1 Tax=Cesiribacter andamanensis AMV16 TaxID=1279009 RepID=M7N5P5_9BACT|nr:tyrosine-protein kinase [Cesiribacter andamanensis]EMR03953.1 Putative tyrosine-protein kinase in cps region [Cesiribacter andamanensis AMV16]